MSNENKCALCLKKKKLCNSHIIPEFFYKFLYDEKHRLHMIPLSKEEKKRYKQKGLREYLLCSNCETQLSKYENYTSKLLYGGVGIWSKSGNPVTFKRINYNYFKLFQLSVLFRASVSDLPFFKNINLGPHEEKIRQMLINKDPGRIYDYPCILIAPKMKEEIMSKDFISIPEELEKIEGHRSYRFIFGGFFWIYLVSSHTSMCSFKNLFLDEKGKLLVPIEKADYFFEKLAKEMFGEQIKGR